MTRTTKFLWGLSCVITTFSAAHAQKTQTVTTDADAGVRVICRGDQSEESCNLPRGGPHSPMDEWDDHETFVRVHDQNALDSGYWHFNLGTIDPKAQITSAKFQLDSQSNSWGDTSVSVVAIIDETKDWDLAALPEDRINGSNAPRADHLPWEEGPTNSNRFNNPTPFLDEGTAKSSPVRVLNDAPILVENQDPNTLGTPEDPGNSYGGFACCDGPGTAGSADDGNNIWPVKNAVDLDVTDLVKWKLGQKADYSTFTASSRELSLMVRTEVPENGGSNGFIRFLTKESPFLGGELGLAPGRLVITTVGGTVSGDFDQNGTLTTADIDLLSQRIAAGSNDQAYDVTGDGKVTTADLTHWVTTLKKTWMGDANLDGEFNSSDFVSVFQPGKFETNQPAGWGEGDWNADLVFSSGDFVAAFQDGGFENGPKAAVSAVPEPTTLTSLVLGGLWLVSCRRRRR